ncbi:MAG: YdcF family protein [Leptospiraceae bacterium]|nr:YdcF family protein [Leptospiraceae bacterium]
MFFYLSKFFTLFLSLYPAAYFLLLILGWRASKGSRRKKTRRLFLAGFLIFGVLSTDACADLILGSLEDQYAQRAPADLPPADGIVVLGGMMDPAAQRGSVPEFTDGANRLFKGLELIRAGLAPTMILSGGNAFIMQGGPSEATVLRDWLIQQQITKPEEVIAENQSRNTAENALHSAEIAGKLGWKRIYLVTSAFHMPRSVAIFEKLTTLEVVAVPTDYRSAAFFTGPEALFPSAHAIQKSWIGIKEYLGIVAYWFRGYI